MKANDLTPVPGFSQRVRPLSPEETRAALRAIHRILVVARDMNRWGTTQADLERVLDATENLPTMLLRPAEFEDLFAVTLADLANAYPAMRGIADEFERVVRLDRALKMVDPIEEKRLAEERIGLELDRWPEY